MTDRTLLIGLIVVAFVVLGMYLVRRRRRKNIWK
jgi:LPXTG-motif cell wall-anchored protein